MPGITKKNVSSLTDELEALLEKYLNTVPMGEIDADDAIAEFTTPRSAEIDKLLMQLHSDGAHDAAAALATHLRRHLDSIPSKNPSKRSKDVISWEHKTASDIHRIVSLDEKVSSYLSLMVDGDDALCDFDYDPTTNKGVGPANSPPIGLLTARPRT